MTLRIKRLREERGLTQDDLASLSGISRSQLAQIESEARPANTLRLNAIAKALDVDVARLFSVSEASDRLIDVLSKCSEEDRESLLRMARALAAQNSAP